MSSQTHPHKQPRILACVLCQHRKIKCDRNTPCSNCVKANVTCTPSTPAPARKRRRPNQDLQERLARCEQLLKQYAGGAVPNAGEVQAATSSSSFSTPTTPAVKPEAIDWSPSSSDFIDRQPSGKLVQQDGSARFMDSQIWGKFYDELQAMRSIIDTEDPEETSVLGTEGLTPDNNADILFPHDPSPTSTEDMHPDPVHSFRLWQIFLDRINPLVKIVHVPTLQPYLVDITTDHSTVPLNYQALFFSIYLMATISLLDHEAMQLLGMSRDQAVQRFALATKLCLAKYDFLRNHDMVALQSLTFFLTALHACHDRSAAWVLSATVIRIAQKMGYHRDGEYLGLPPFETEMRRRIWWQIIMQDAKLSIVSGINHSFLKETFDTKQPLNLSDSDLFPGSTEPLQPREGPTEMAFALITNRLARFVVSDTTMKTFEAAIMREGLDDHGVQSEADATNTEHYRRMIRELEFDLRNIEQRFCDPSAGSVHAAALAIRPQIVQKFNEMLVPMREQPEWGSEIFGPRDNLFKIVLMNNEHNTDMYEQMSQEGYLWYVKMHFQLDVFAVLTGQLVKRPTGSLSDRGWQIVEKIYKWQTELFDVAQKQYAAQAQFTLKAWRAREKAFAANGTPIIEPEFITRLRELVPSNHDSRASTQASATPPGQGIGGGMGLRRGGGGGGPHQPPHHHQPINDLDQFLGGYLDVSALNWDVWGDMGPPSVDGHTPQGSSSHHASNVGNQSGTNAFNSVSGSFLDGFNLTGFGHSNHMQ